MIKSLTSLRFVFALMVFTHHLDFTRPGADNVWTWWLDNVFDEGYIGVTFFFILSGFILSYTYKKKLLEKKVSYGQFMTSRVTRIFPMHVLTLLISLPLIIRESVYSNVTDFFTHLLPNAALVQSFIPLESYYFSFNGLSWSISDEMFFYAMFPILLLLFCRFRNAVAILIFCLLIVSIPLSMRVVSNDNAHYFFYINPATRIVDFVIGIGIYFVFDKIKPENVDRINFNMLELLAVSILLISFVFHEYVLQPFRYSCYYWLPISFVIFSFSFQRGLISRFLSNRIFVLLGEISFSFYLLHVLVIRYFLVVNGKFLHVDNPYVVVFLVFSTAVFLSYCSFIAIERPIHSYFGKTRF